LTTFLQPRHIPTRGYNITQSSAPDDGYMVAQNMLSNYLKRNKEYKKWHLVGFSYPHWITMHGQPHIRIQNIFDSFAAVSATVRSIECDSHVLLRGQPVHLPLLNRPVSIWPHSLHRCQSHTTALSFSAGTFSAVDTRAQIMIHLSLFLCKRVRFVSESVWVSWRSNIA